MNRTVKFILAANLLALTVLVFVFPHLMISPGKLIPGHKQLEADCFACHVAWRGSAAERCIACHAPKDIGRLTTSGQAIVRAKAVVPFHQELNEDNCTACHTDHAGTRRRDHNTRCVTCHVRNDYSRYTCYGCHEHSLGKIRREHIEEGIDRFDDCVECHRSADEHDIRGRGARGSKHEGRRKHDDD